MNRVEKKQYTKRFGQYDRYLVLLVIALCGFGCLMIYSASSFNCSLSAACNFDGMYYVKKQLLFGLLPGILLMLIFWRINYRYLQFFAIPAILAAALSIVALKTPLAHASHGAVRWLRVGPVTIQVAEIVKICLIIYLASRIAMFYSVMNIPGYIGRFWFTAFVFAAFLTLISSNLSSALIVLAICYCMTLISSKNVKMHLILAFFGSVLVGGYVFWRSHNLPDPDKIANMSYRTKRIAGWLAPEKYASTAGYQILQSLYAVANGGLFGKGLGQGIQKLKRIPEAQNDMIFSIICEELGIIGGVIVIMAYFVLVYLIIRIGMDARDLFGSLICMGVAAQIGFQAIINVGVAVNFIPNTGASLPFVSYGGTSLLLLLAEIGIVLSIRRIKVRDQSKHDYEVDQKLKREEQNSESKKEKEKK